MALGDLASLTTKLTAPPQSLSLVLPGGAALVAQMATVNIPDPLEVAKQLMGQANSALAPLVPLFNILDVALALFQTVKGLPDAILKLDPSEIVKALPDLAEKAAKLATLVPQLSVPLAILGLIDVLIAFLGGLVDQLEALVAEEARIQAAADRAAELGNVQLAGVVDVAKGNVAVQMQSLAGACAPVNQLIALINVFMQLIGLKGLPNLSDLGPDAAAALAPIKDVVTTLQTIRKTIPV